MSNVITITDNNFFKTLYDGSAYTIIGCAGDFDEWMNGYNELLEDLKIGQVETFYTFTGKQMNEYYHLKGDAKYKDDLIFLSFLLDGLDVSKLAMVKLRFEDRWFDDIVDNNTAYLNCETI